MKAQEKKDEQNWMLEFRKGSDQAFGMVFKQYYAALCYFANRYVRDKQQAEDLVEDVFEKLWISDRKQENSDHLRAYLYLATKRSCIDHLRKAEHEKERQLNFVMNSVSETTEHLQEMIRAEILREIYLEIKNLPAQCSKIMAMSYMEGLKNEEIAQKLGISIQTIKNQKSKGLSLLKNKLSPDFFLLFIILLEIK